MDPKQAARWDKLCLELIESRRIITIRDAGKLDRDEKLEQLRQRYRAKTKETIGSCVASVYLATLLDYLSGDSGRQGKAEKAIARALDRDPSTLYRWRTRQTLPESWTFFVGLIAFKLRLREIPTLRREQVIAETVCRALQYIHDRELKRRHCAINPDELIYLTLIYRLPGSQILADRSGSQPMLRRSLMEKSLDTLEHRLADAISTERINELVREYLIPYALYDFGRPLKWEFLNEIET